MEHVKLMKRMGTIYLTKPTTHKLPADKVLNEDTVGRQPLVGVLKGGFLA